MISRLGKAMLGKYLWVTNSFSCGLLLGVGDGIQQCIEREISGEKERLYDWKRTGQMFIVGLSQGPPHHIWYTQLDVVFPKRNFSTVCYKILADQIIAAPLFAMTFFIGMALVQGKGLSAGVEEFKKKFLALYMFDWCFWPPVQSINFMWIPAQYRVIYINIATVFWDVYLSYIKFYDQPRPKKP
ncbi:mpv17-like protein 2 [Ischnura elegans]|uniref:mpv17-like protein 2 n=1 Tax=Ischnura elegans TaxID=197161 RepID=UPI001ED88D03|nr:mpv17-like protein 2 [Ischnura elegans]